jgi:hypothetical protein
MPKYTRNTGKPWTQDDENQLKKLAKQDTPTPVIGLKLGRTPAAIYKKASELGISLMPLTLTTRGAAEKIEREGDTREHDNDDAWD